MCGIFGYIGKENAYNQVLEGLKLLQYRGYDSCGIAYYNNQHFEVEKAIGALTNLKNVNTKSNIAFGHTRWATNGKVTISNTHPHTSYDGNFTIVHNGIIENANKLKEQLEKQGVVFSSQTDTEVIANLLTCLNGSPDQRILSLHKYLEGSYSLIIGLKDGTIYLVKKFSPLNLLKCNGEIYISSDSSSLKSGELYCLKDYDVIKIYNNEITLLNGETLKFISHNNKIENLSIQGYNHYMQKEIFETPKAIYNTFNFLTNINIKKIFCHFKKLTFIGCGTAFHACLIGQQLFSNLNYVTFCCSASNYSINKKISKKHLHIIVSQSGETADCIKIAKQIKQFKGKLLIITNEEKSSLTHFANYTILTQAGKEMAVASTKTYCSQIFAFVYIAEKLKNINYCLDINDLVNKLKNYINSIDISSAVKILQNKDKLIMVAKDADYITLLEASLKIREIDYIYTLPMYSGELKHGTLSLIDKDSVVICLNTSHDKNRLQNVTNEILSRGGTTIEFNLYLDNVKENYKPIFYIIPFQLLSYNLALEKGINPDMPRNLAKSVTVE